jgi:hypothetical protein
MTEAMSGLEAQNVSDYKVAKLGREAESRHSSVGRATAL